MSNQTITYTLVATLLGMGVVFLSLWVLSLIISVIKALFGEKSNNGKPSRTHETDDAGSNDGARATRGAVKGRKPKGHPKPDEGGAPDWVIAAASAYVLEETLDAHRSAAAWTPQPTRSVDPWLLNVSN